MMLETLDCVEMTWLKPSERHSSVYLRLQDAARREIQQRKRVSQLVACCVCSSDDACVPFVPYLAVYLWK
jgi:hypothetical protein